MNRILEDAEGLRERLTAHRRYLHQNAEIGFDLPKTCAYVEKVLIELGYEPQKCGRSGLIATLGNPKNKPVVLLRADMDGLPIEEKSRESFSCETGKMHACGHDLHTAMLLGAAELLKKRENRVKGCIKLLFQPAEETLEGAEDCLKNGLLSPCKPNCAVMLHVLTDLPIETGTLIVSSPGVSAPAADFFRIRIQGKACHGSTPWKGVDALSVGGHILLALQTMTAREVPMGEAVLTVGRMQSGSVGNAIADECALEGTLRTFDEEERKRIKRRIGEIAIAQAECFFAEAKTEFLGGCPTLVNDEGVSALAYQTACGLLGKGKAVFSAALGGGEVGKRSGGSEDFGYISHEIPAVMVGLAAGERKGGFCYPLHHPKACFDENVLPIGAAFLTAFALAERE